MQNLEIVQTKESVIISLKEKYKVLSSAVAGGGLKTISDFIILKVDENYDGKKDKFEAPEITLKKFAYSKGIRKNFIGMMTSAKMESFREVEIENQSVKVSLFLTAGVSNAKRAGDKAEYTNINELKYEAGTINIICLINLPLTDEALVEAIMIITEAKSVALQMLNIKTYDTKTIATGTGTDSIAVGCRIGKNGIRYCGKHTLLGEIIAKSVIKALLSSLSK